MVFSSSFQDTGLRESMSTEWTDEKHSLFLKSMEASFVNDLYNYFDSPRWKLQREHSSALKFAGKKRALARISSSQVLCRLSVYALLLARRNVCLCAFPRSPLPDCIVFVVLICSIRFFDVAVGSRSISKDTNPNWTKQIGLVSS